MAYIEERTEKEWAKTSENAKNRTADHYYYLKFKNINEKRSE